ncbi:MAG: FHA domain-containing protein [Planctomycetota bacterium]|jgi:hypothetical protein
MLRLTIRTSSGETTFSSDRGEILVGRREGVDLVLPEPHASRNHCLLRVEGNGVRMIDLETANGTVVGGDKVTQALLVPGQEFRIGATTIRLLAFATPEAAGSAPAAHAPKLEIEPDPPPRPRQAPVPGHAPAADFGREVRALLRKAPWYTLSLAFHVVALLALDLVAFKVTRFEQEPALAAIDPAQLEEIEDLVEGTEPSLDDLQPEVDPLEEDHAPDDLVSQPVRKDPMDADIDFEDLVPPERLGLLGDWRPIKKLDIPLPRTAVKGADQLLNKGDLQGEQGRATDTVKRDLGRGLRETKRRVTRAQIVVVQGDFDKIEKVLGLYGWPHTLIERRALLTHRYSQAKLLFINCGRKPAQPQRRKLISIVKAFVSRGGWVVTSDWSIDPYITGSFPDRVRVTKPKRRQPDTTITVHPMMQDSLLSGVFSHRARTAWWLEETSTMIAVSDNVDVLVASEEMARRYGSKVVVFRLRYGSGRVLHLLGHFYQKDGNRMGLVGMHRLINNVILQRFRPKN